MIDFFKKRIGKYFIWLSWGRHYGVGLVYFRPNKQAGFIFLGFSLAVSWDDEDDNA